MNMDEHILDGGFNHIETYESQWEGLFPYIMEKHVPNHQPVFVNQRNTPPSVPRRFQVCFHQRPGLVQFSMAENACIGLLAAAPRKRPAPSQKSHGAMNGRE